MFKAIETCIILSVVDTKMCFEKRSLIKQQLPLRCTRQQFKFVKMFSELADVPKSNEFIHFIKIKFTTWSTNKIIPVSMALVGCHVHNPTVATILLNV